MKTKKTKKTKSAPKTNNGKKRGYSQQFTAARKGAVKSYNLDKMPSALFRAAQAQSKRTGVSVRAYLLQALTDWVEAGASWKATAPPEPEVIERRPKGIVQPVTSAGVVPPVPCPGCNGTGQVVLSAPTVETQTVAVCGRCEGRGVVPAVA